MMESRAYGNYVFSAEDPYLAEYLNKTVGKSTISFMNMVFQREQMKRRHKPDVVGVNLVKKRWGERLAIVFEHLIYLSKNEYERRGGESSSLRTELYKLVGTNEIKHRDIELLIELIENTSHEYQVNHSLQTIPVLDMTIGWNMVQVVYTGQRKGERLH